MTLAIELAETLRVPMRIAEHALQEISDACVAGGPIAMPELK